MQAMQGFRLSPQQRQLWELAQDGADQLSHCALLMEGDLDRQNLRELIGQLVARHEILRTSFYRQPGLKVPLQVIGEIGSPSLRELDLQEPDSRRTSERLERELVKQRQNKGDRQSASPLDVLLACIGPGRHVLSLALPPVCCDTLTLTNLAREITLGLESGQLLSDQEEAVQYLQFSEWQNDLLEDEESGQSGLDYWRSISAGNSPKRELPFVRGQGGSSQEIQRCSLSIAGPTLDRIEVTLVECGASMSAFLLACWKTLLWRLSGEPEVRVGFVCDGRKFKEMETALGPFAVTVPLQAHFDEGFLFSDVLRRVGQRLEEALSWQEYFLLSDAAKEADAGWPTVFEFAEWPLPSACGKLSVSLHSRSVNAGRFAVKMFCSREHDRLTLELAWNPSAVAREFARNVLAQFKTLLEHAAESPGLPVETLRILSDEDQRRIAGLRENIRDWSDTGDVVEMFNTWAAKTPRANAVVSGEKTLTYADLNEEVSGLGRYLASLGVRPEVCVLLLLPRSEHMVVSILGVLKAGAAYVPVEPATPAARLRYLIEETGAAFVITVESLLPLLAELTVTRIVLDRDRQAIAAGGSTPLPKALPRNLAYILFTSGSTGRPKGVAIERGQLHNYIMGVMERLKIGPGLNLAIVSSFAADLGNTMLFPALCGGGCLHVIPAEKVTDTEAVAVYFDRNKIEYLKIVPSHFSALLSAADNARQLVPRTALVFGGEALSWSLLDQVLEVAPECRVFNHYGPTETTVGVMTCEAEGRLARWSATVPLGRPLPNIRLYVVDDRQRPVPTGVPGELLIGGAGVCRGYRGHAELTAERFLPDPWSDDPGARLYRTGDRVRLLPEGTLEYLDRLDRQIKVRGFRVEPGEIEAEILKYPGVRQAAVELLPTASGESLVGFVGAGKDEKITGDQLRNFMRNVLPEHMVPAAFVILDVLPLTANGKIDRQVLKAFENVEKKSTSFVSPREMGEVLLVGLWREVLGVPRVGVRDNFFHLGGDSLIATQLISRVRKLFQIELPVRIVFEAPTVAEMAFYVERALSGHSELKAPPIEPVSREGEMVLSFGQERLWGIHQLDPLSCAYNSTSTLRLKGPLKEDALAQALNEIVRRHEVLRTTFATTDGLPRQVIHPPAPAELIRISIETREGHNVEAEILRLANEHGQQPFDLEHGPLLRLKLLRIDEETNILLVSMHHIVTDGWSQNIFMRELTVLYDCYCHNRPSPLPELKIQYADFAAWQRQWLQGQALDDLLAYWKKQLEGAPEALEFPADYPRPQQATYQGSCIVWEHPPHQLEQLRQLSRNEGVTLFMTLLTTYYVFLHHYTGQEDIAVGTDIANRNRIETEDLIGFFVNNLALRVDLSGNPTFRELLNRVRVAALGAYAHQDLPFAILVKALQPRRSLSHTPVFQTLFALQSIPAADTVPKELEVTPLNADMTTCKFDLALLIAESEEGLIAYWTYRRELFSPETVVEIGKDFNRVLADIFRHLDSPLTTLLQSERKQRHGKNLRISKKAIHSDQEKLDPALRN